MYKVAGTLLALLLTVTVASAQQLADVDPLVTSGYRLGKYHMSSALLAGELMYIQALSEEMSVARVTDENYEAGEIGVDDVNDASLVLAYSIWRAQLMVLPLCAGGLEHDALSDPILEELREPLQEQLIEIEQLTETFLESADFASLALYCEQLAAGGYVDRLLELSDAARILAGIEE